MPKVNWVVRIRATVLKDVYCTGCTEAEAREQPYEHVEDEEEVDQEDFEVLSVKPDPC